MRVSDSTTEGQSPIVEGNPYESLLQPGAVCLRDQELLSENMSVVVRGYLVCRARLHACIVLSWHSEGNKGNKALSGA